GCQDDDCVEHVPAGHQLDGIRYHFAAHQRGLHALGTHRDTGADCDSVDFHRHATGLTDPFLDLLGELTQAEVAGHCLDPGVGNATIRLPEVFFSEANGVQV